ncbi:hypothetical protein [Streptomyces scabiei]|uniref:hypothetical protein n=1 Tax=Streptomyces scabiei TaxID=1930 RepID=UPI0004E6BDC2|nr:hypothetical protein [Streptomyces scabiei]KFG04029.1 hypothetical protein IQ61_38055 [Streptomyces scabiei]MDX2533205.1 hypothetical protein [Streptomyces scabiei]MDX2798283.1 hypothetical protein [Streptomyces scabiei]MDX2832499.1 hypothetical protein [Streptomyces scabiei]MDX2859877.1 hypothetical protein [Streptomyces scabiei]
MGFQERWQSRQEELAARAEVREDAAADQWDDFVERLQGPILEQARLAFERGDGWFETEIDQRSSGSLNPYGNTGMDLGSPAVVGRIKADRPEAPPSPRGDLLSRIEDVGWKLHTAQYLYVQLGEESRDKWLSSGQRVAIKGKIVGMYLFERVKLPR